LDGRFEAGLVVGKHLVRGVQRAVARAPARRPKSGHLSLELLLQAKKGREKREERKIAKSQFVFLSMKKKKRGARGGALRNTFSAC
jgi:hypothetical protein